MPPEPAPTIVPPFQVMVEPVIVVFWPEKLPVPVAVKFALMVHVPAPPPKLIVEPMVLTPLFVKSPVAPLLANVELNVPPPVPTVKLPAVCEYAPEKVGCIIVVVPPLIVPVVKLDVYVLLANVPDVAV